MPFDEVDFTLSSLSHWQGLSFLPVEKTELFLELFGNSLIRAQTADYLREKATDLIKYVHVLSSNCRCTNSHVLILV